VLVSVTWKVVVLNAFRLPDRPPKGPALLGIRAVFVGLSYNHALYPMPLDLSIDMFYAVIPPSNHWSAALSGSSSQDIPVVICHAMS
jgi:hypothetical protein